MLLTRCYWVVRCGDECQVATPPEFEPNPAIVERSRSIAVNQTQVMVTHDPEAAAKGASVLYDVWASMGQEAQASSNSMFQPYQINEQLLSIADPEAIVLHCLPAHRGEEITDAVMEASQSRVWDQAENGCMPKGSACKFIGGFRGGSL